MPNDKLRSALKQLVKTLLAQQQRSERQRSATHAVVDWSAGRCVNGEWTQPPGWFATFYDANGRPIGRETFGLGACVPSCMHDALKALRRRYPNLPVSLHAPGALYAAARHTGLAIYC